MCTSLLTSTGWEATTTIEGLLMYLHSNLIEGKARIDFSNLTPYNDIEAKEAFKRVARDHGWDVTGLIG